MNRPELRERLAKAYCAPENQFKVVDPVLIESMVDQIIGKERANNKKESKEDIKAWKSKG